DLAAGDQELVHRVELYVPNDTLQGEAPRTRSALTVPSGCDNVQYNGPFAKLSWALKQYTTPIRAQGKRGTCAAFGVVAGLDARLFRTPGVPTDYSEQMLYATGKGRWYPTSDAYGDGLFVDDVLDGMLDHAYQLDVEARWPYNKAPHRVDDEDHHKYTSSCT